LEMEENWSIFFHIQTPTRILQAKVWKIFYQSWFDTSSKSREAVVIHYVALWVAELNEIRVFVHTYIVWCGLLSFRSRNVYMYM
jgi:hypothetical protein